MSNEEKCEIMYSENSDSLFCHVHLWGAIKYHDGFLITFSPWGVTGEMGICLAEMRKLFKEIGWIE